MNEGNKKVIKSNNWSFSGNADTRVRHVSLQEILGQSQYAGECSSSGTQLAGVGNIVDGSGKADTVSKVQNPEDCFSCPPDETVIWRYMDFVSFQELLRKNEMYFNALRNMDDNKEGLPLQDLGLDFSKRDYSDGAKGYLDFFALRHALYVSSWSMYDEDKLVLWFERAPQNGVAIKTTVGNLKQSLEGETMHYGRIVYIDKIPDDIAKRIEDGTENYFWFAVNKDVKFQYENEFRAIFGDSTAACKQLKQGMSKPVKLEILIDEIYVNPMSDAFFSGLVEEQLTLAKIGHKPVRRNCDLLKTLL